jgi:hypothetical protein
MLLKMEINDGRTTKKDFKESRNVNFGDVSSIMKGDTA